MELPISFFVRSAENEQKKEKSKNFWRPNEKPPF